MHYMRWWKHGSTDSRAKPRLTCTFEGCTERAKSKGLCVNHYSAKRQREARARAKAGEVRICDYCHGAIPVARKRSREGNQFCSAECKRSWWNNTGRNAEEALRRYYENKYGLTIAEVERMREGGCAICGDKDFLKGKFKNGHVDHDHATGKVRGILCNNCNIMIGHAHDDSDLLVRAAAYLRGELAPV